jgi:hypothetical protein
MLRALASETQFLAVYPAKSQFKHYIILNDINMEKTFIRVRSAKDITIFSTLIILGSVLVALPTGAGIILALVLRTGYEDTETGEKFLLKEYYFQQAMNTAISNALESRPDSIDLNEADKGNALKLDIYYSRRCSKAYLQLFEYIPYRYEPCSRMYEYEAGRVEKLLK